MELTRRDALVALGGLGAVGSGIRVAERLRASDSVNAAQRRALRAVAAVLYPPAVDVDQSFVDTYVAGRYDDAERVRRLDEALSHLDAVSRDRTGDPLVDASVPEREAVLEAAGLDRVAARPEGRLPERVRYYVVDDLLFALYSTPVGSRLVGQENPTGYPGGLEAYQREPEP